MKKKLKFKCWNRDCNRDYSLLIVFEGKPKLHVECPFCGKDAIVDLDPYKNSKIAITKDGQTIQDRSGNSYTLPEIVPTREKTEEEKTEPAG